MELRAGRLVVALARRRAYPNSLNYINLKKGIIMVDQKQSENQPQKPSADQPTKSKPQKEDKLKIRTVTFELETYLRVFILPQVPADYKEFRDIINNRMIEVWHELYLALSTQKRERQRHLLLLKVELATMETYVEEIRKVCYRGKAANKLDQNSKKRFGIFANKYKEVMSIVWGWIKNEERKNPSGKIEKLAGLAESSEV